MRVRGRMKKDEPAVDVLIEGDRISQVERADRARDGDLGAENLCLAPGFIDLQSNGYDGVDFNDAQASLAQIAEATRRLWRTGVTSFCPTIITASPAHIAQCLSNLGRAAEELSEVSQATLGIHLEGPFISPEDGPRGAHPREHVCPPDWDQFQRWQDAARGQIRILTLAPEWPAAMSFIERATESAVIVAIGHTAASPAQIADAVRAGAKLSTHLGNGSHAKIDRHPNYIWEQLATDALWASFIVDGHHLPPAVVKCFLRCKTPARSILVTDAIAAAGRPAGRHRLGNVEVEVTTARKVCLPGTPYLAGSVLEMHEAIAKTVAYSDVALDEAVGMATAQPARLLGVTEERGSIAPGGRADLVLFNWHEAAKTLEIFATILAGQIVYLSKELAVSKSD